MKEVKEITKQEFLEELRLASEESLNNYDADKADEAYDEVMKALDDVDRAVAEEASLEYKKQMIEELYLDNEVLQDYIKVLAEIERVRKVQEDAKQLYTQMHELNIDGFEGTFCNIVLTKPYDRRQINSSKFFSDYKPESAEYKKYVEVKQVKGHITLKKKDK